jgi:hypothetical protein
MSKCFTTLVEIYFNLAICSVFAMPMLHLMQHHHPIFNTFYLSCSECQEKYLRELSITPVGYFTGVIKKKSLPCGVPQELFCSISEEQE